MSVIVLSLGAALGWGTADFLAGRTSRTTPALVVLWFSQLIGLAMVLAAALVAGLDSPAGHDLLYAALAGAALMIGLGALYQAMAVGAMAIAAPIAATGVVIPVAFGLAGGDSLSMVQCAGLVAAVGGVALCSYDPGAVPGRGGLVARGVGFALLAAVFGGINSTALSEASSSGVLWVLMVQRAAVATLALTIVLGQNGPSLPSRRAMRSVVAVGILDLTATGLFTAATVDGELSLVAVLSSIYPVVTIMLAYVILAERVRRHQAIGAFTAMAGVAAVSAG